MGFSGSCASYPGDGVMRGRRPAHATNVHKPLSGTLDLRDVQLVPFIHMRQGSHKNNQRVAKFFNIGIAQLNPPN